MYVEKQLYKAPGKTTCSQRAFAVVMVAVVVIAVVVVVVSAFIPLSSSWTHHADIHYPLSAYPAAAYPPIPPLRGIAYPPIRRKINMTGPYTNKNTILFKKGYMQN